MQDENGLPGFPEPPLRRTHATPPLKPAEPPASTTTPLPPGVLCGQNGKLSPVGDDKDAPNGAPKENPKAAFGRRKVRYFFTPPIFRAAVALVLELGAKKYGPFNWRKDPVNASDYIDAIQRHLDAWADGEDLDPESKIVHLAHVSACCAILIDAEACGTLIDDRQKSNRIAEFFAKIAAGGGKVS